MTSSEHALGKTQSTSPDTLPNIDDHQLTLSLDLPISRRVEWYHGEETTNRHLLFWKKTVTRIIMNQDTYLPQKTSVDTGTIPNFKDRDLRYALAFADAARAVGYREISPTMSTAHSVGVVATDEGMNSRLLKAQYTGVGEGTNDTFMQNLHSADPRQLQA